MAQRKLTDAMILDAINEIVARGEHPTTTLIHDQVGNIGSFATINKVFHPWRDRNEKEVNELPVEILLPSELEDSFTQLAKKVWNQATQISTQELDKQREALAQIEQEIKQELSDAIKIGEVSENARIELQEQLEKQTILNSELSKTNVLLEKENNMLKKQVEDNEQLKSENNKQSTEIAVLKSKLDDAQKVITDMNTLLDDIQKENKNLNAKMDKQAKNIILLNNENTINKGEIERLKEKAEGLAIQLKDTKSKLSDAISSAILKEKEVGVLEGRIEQMQSQLDEQKKTYEKLLDKSLRGTKQPTK